LAVIETLDDDATLLGGLAWAVAAGATAAKAKAEKPTATSLRTSPSLGS
jgi:hypothetical protein